MIPEDIMLGVWGKGEKLVPRERHFEWVIHLNLNEVNHLRKITTSPYNDLGGGAGVT